MIGKSQRFTVADHVVFESVEDLCQRCGVPADRLRRLVVKELVDNALDDGTSCKLGIMPNGAICVEDTGPGFAVEELGQIFSVARAMETTKLWRLPTRGALGNGLRVVTGAVIASEGTLIVWTRNRCCRIIPQRDGLESLVISEPADFPVGTRIEILLGDAIPQDPDVLEWGQLARDFPLCDGYKGKSSAHWYSVDSGHKLFRAAKGATVRDLVRDFEGCAEPKAGSLVNGFHRRKADSLTRSEVALLLETIREHTTPVKPARLGPVGKHEAYGPAYTIVMGEMPVSDKSPEAKAPYIIEAWARLSAKDSVQIFVNRSPITTEPFVYRRTDKKLGVSACELYLGFDVPKDQVSFTLSIQAPYLPILSDSKAPDLSLLDKDVQDVMSKAANKLPRGTSKPKSKDEATEKDIIIENLDAAIAKASGGGEYRYSIRQLYYAVRPYVQEEKGKELTYKWFEDVVTDCENEGVFDLSGIYRDNRGTLYHPHIHQEIAVGTLSVEKYRRPEWVFNKILYIEKEGFFEILKAVKWAERHDCALVTGKGFAPRAHRDLLDLLGETGEDLEFYAIHDADADGTMIYQTLVEGTRARPGRRVRIINLGLEPREGVEMGLEIEKVTKKKKAPVANYVPLEWKKWLKTQRIELNAMTTPQFLEWLDRKFEQASGKLIPPVDVMEEHRREKARRLLEQGITERILREADIDGCVARAFADLAPKLRITEDDLIRIIQEEFKESEEKRALHWSATKPNDADLRGIVETWLEKHQEIYP